MNYDTAVQTLGAVILVCIGLYLWLFSYRSYRIDEFRQRIFDLRDKMFDYSAERGLFDQPAYKNLRLIMNGSLRFAESLSIWFCLFMLLLHKVSLLPEPRRDFREEISEELGQIGDLAVQTELSRYHEEFQFEVIRFLIVRSLPLYAIFLLLSVVLIAISRLRDTKTKYMDRFRSSSGMRTIENQSFLLGGGASV